MYVEANIQECEAIVYYLLQQPHRLNLFLKQYDAWRCRMRQLGGPFSTCERILHEHNQARVDQNDQAAMLDALRSYQEQNLPCSFLERDACMIHEVRPYTCCNHYVTTPSEWCGSGNLLGTGSMQKPRVYLTNVDGIYDRSFYVRDLAKPAIGFMPSMVFNLFSLGLEYVEEMTGPGALMAR
jgi:Fe-S-cluster containining protein